MRAQSRRAARSLAIAGNSSVPMAKASPVLAEMAAMDAGFARTPISAGDVNLSVTVQVVFAIVG